MKKFLFALVVAAALAFVGCGKDDSSDGKTKFDGTSLKGTSWVMEESGYSEDVLIKVSYTFKFVDATTFSFVYESSWKGGGEKYSYNGFYVYEAPNVTLYWNDGETDPLHGTVNSERMVLYDSDDDIYGIFARK